MVDVTHEEIEEMLGAYALDAVSPEERDEIERHLRECPRCQQEVTAHLQVAGVLGSLGGSAPAGLWDRIAGELAIGSGGPVEIGDVPRMPRVSGAADLADPRDLSGASGSASASDEDEDEGAAPSDGDEDFAPSDADQDTAPGAAGDPPADKTTMAPLIALDGGRARRDDRSKARQRTAKSSGDSGPRPALNATTLAMTSVAAALLIVVGVLGFTIVGLNHRVQHLQSAIVTGGVSGQVQAALTDPGHQTVDLASAVSGQPWNAEVVLDHGMAFLVPGKMPSISANDTFQAWAVVGGKYVSLGVIGNHPTDEQLQLQPGMSKVLVNTEPQGGTAQPTNPAVLTAPLPSTV